MPAMLCALLCLLLALTAACFAAGPAILFCSPQGPVGGWVDLGYLEELHQKGFEVDYTDSLAELTWERIRQYNVLLIYTTPDAFEVTIRGGKSSPERVEQFVTLIERYLEAGGGVFLMPWETNILKQCVADLTDRWGLKFPVETIVESDPQKQGALTHSAHATPLAFTDQVLATPVSAGVQGIWYPVQPAYNGGMSGPLLVDDHWQVVVKASKTAATKPVDLAQAATPLPEPFMRAEGVPEPPLFAIRNLGAGRVAVVCQWPQFSVGSGTKWIFNREVLELGVKGKPSDYGHLLENTFRWLAEPSMASGTVGGYVTAPERLLPPNAQEAVKREYAERFWPYEPAQLGSYQVPPQLKLYRGVIGAKTTYSTGAGTVAEYAAAARESGLDFLVFMDDFDKLTLAEFEQLKADCVQHSGEDLLLLAGFNITNNIGNHLFFYGPDPPWPIDKVLCGPNKSLLYMQEENDKGGFTGYLTPFLDWVLSAYHVDKGQVGYYNFQDSPHGMRLPDCRLYAAVGLRYYRNGQLVEDLTDDYLTTAECTIPPAPMAINEVLSPQELRREVASGHALTYAQGESLDRNAPRGVFQMALRWTHQYDGLNVFISDGPKILAWPGCHRVWTYGGEEFVTGPAVMPSPLVVTAEKGLKALTIYNGRRLFRRILLHGEREFNQTLVLDGTIQKNLVLIAEDQEGGKAVSFARRCWKDGALAPTFCSDHVNDGGHMYLAHGPNALPINYHPSLSSNIAGDTWDGGPPAALPLVGYQNTLPVLESDQGKEDAGRMNQLPLLEFTDEGVAAVANLRTELFDDRLERVVNPWHTYGPIAGPTKLFDNYQYYREWVTPTVDVPRAGWAAPGIRVGVNASLFTDTLRFKQSLTVERLYLGSLQRRPEAQLVVSNADGLTTVDLGSAQYPSFLVRPGDWFGLYSTGLSNSHLYINRGETLELRLSGALELLADAKGRRFAAGDEYRFELAAFGFPINVKISSAEDFQRYLAYLREPTGLQVLRGTRQASVGPLEFLADDYGVELVVPQPSTRLDLTLPVCVLGLNPRWSAGLFQKQGYSKGFHGPGENRYRALGVDGQGVAYIPLYVDYAPTTHVLAGHPVVADEQGRALFIQVTKVGSQPDRWHVSVNNPTDQPITTRLRRALDLPGLDLAETTVTLEAGEYRVIQ